MKNTLTRIRSSTLEDWKWIAQEFTLVSIPAGFLIYLVISFS